MKCQKARKGATQLLAIAGALNWLLVGAFEFDLVVMITGNDFGEATIYPE